MVAIAAARLALHGRGAAVITESFNSNPLNIVGGVCLPAVFLGLGKITPRTVFALWWRREPCWVEPASAILRKRNAGNFQADDFFSKNLALAGARPTSLALAPG
jgi:hypothetical protein